MSVLNCFNPVFVFQIVVLKMTSRGFTDLGAQTGNETQFDFSEGDVRHNDADDTHNLAVGYFVILRSIKFLWINTVYRLAFSVFVFQPLRFSAASSLGMCFRVSFLLLLPILRLVFLMPRL